MASRNPKAPKHKLKVGQWARMKKSSGDAAKGTLVVISRHDGFDFQHSTDVKLGDRVFHCDNPKRGGIVTKIDILISTWVTVKWDKEPGKARHKTSEHYLQNIYKTGTKSTAKYRIVWGCNDDYEYVEEDVLEVIAVPKFAVAWTNEDTDPVERFLTLKEAQAFKKKILKSGYNDQKVIEANIYKLV